MTAWVRGLCLAFVELHERYRRYTSWRSKVSQEEPALSSSQMAFALEFFLQMDGNCACLCQLLCSKIVVFCLVDAFFMKTCAFRGAEPRSTTEGLFCGDIEPSERYEMSPCSEQSCLCCNPLNIEKRHYRWLVVNFEDTSKHQFCKEFTSYLNAPAVSSSFDGSCQEINLKFRFVKQRISSMR